MEKNYMIHFCSGATKVISQETAKLINEAIDETVDGKKLQRFQTFADDLDCPFLTINMANVDFIEEV